MKYWKGEYINKLEENEVFVFGANPQARHFAGAAKVALGFGAIPIDRKRGKPGIARGLSPNGKTYALITKSLEAGYTEPDTGITYHKEGFQSVSPEQIRFNIKELYETARMAENIDKKFIVTYKYEAWPNGTPKKSLNGYTSLEMLEMFVKDQDVPPNIIFHDSYQDKIGKYLNQKNDDVQSENSQPFSYSQAILTDNQPRSNFTFFWYTPSPFSQWHPSLFEVKGFTFTSCEQFMMFCKAKLFKDEEIANEILSLNVNGILKMFANKEITTEEILKNAVYRREWDNCQKLIKNLGRKVKNYNEELWVKNRENYVFRGNYEKFSQNDHLKKKLLATGNTIMAEGNYFDKIWAIGIKESDVDATSPSKWKGLNLLGKILTNLREQLKLTPELNNSQKKNVEKQKVKRKPSF